MSEKKQALWTWAELKAADPNFRVPKVKPPPVIEIINRATGSTRVIKRKKAA